MMTEDEATIEKLKGALVRLYASDFGFVKMAEQPTVKSYAGVMPIFGESPFGDWQGSMHNPIPENPDFRATNIHVSDSWAAGELAERFGKCFRVIDSDIHFFCADNAAVDAMNDWIKTLPPPDAKPPNQAVIAGYPYGVRGGNPIVSSIGSYSIDHIPGRPDCHWFNVFSDPNAGGKSGSPAFASNAFETSDTPFGINVARGYTWNTEADAGNHWAVIQCYHNKMTLTPG